MKHEHSKAVSEIITHNLIKLSQTQTITFFLSKRYLTMTEKLTSSNQQTYRKIQTSGTVWVGISPVGH